MAAETLYVISLVVLRKKSLFASIHVSYITTTEHNRDFFNKHEFSTVQDDLTMLSTVPDWNKSNNKRIWCVFLAINVL